MTHFPDSQDTAPVKPSLWALSPLLVFFLLYLVISVAVQDFYAVPVTVAFTAAAVWAVLITRGKSMAELTPLFPKICFHTTDTAILPPIMEGI